MRLALFLFLLMGVRADAEKCQRWSKQSSGHCKAVMMQIHLYKNQRVVKLKWGCRGEEAVWKMNRFYARWRIFPTSRQTLMHLISHRSFAFASFCCAIGTTACPWIHETVMFLWLTQLPSPFLQTALSLWLFQWAPQSHTSQTCRSHDWETVLLF